MRDWFYNLSENHQVVTIVLALLLFLSVVSVVGAILIALAKVLYPNGW